MRLGEKYFNNEEVIRIMTDVANVLYKKKIKVYSETFKEYRWMLREDIETDYKLLIPLAFLKIFVINAIPSTNDVDDLFIEVLLNENSMFVDKSQMDDEYIFGEYNYSHSFYRLNNLIDCTKSLMKENHRILTDDKSLESKLSLILDQYSDNTEDFYLFQAQATKNEDTIRYKSVISMAIYINDYYKDILQILDSKVKVYDEIVSNSFAKIKEICTVDFKINTLEQIMKMYGVIDSVDIRIGVDSLAIKTITPVIKENELNTLYMFDNESLNSIAQHTFFSRMNDMMILKFWYDINIDSFTYDYRLVRDLNTGDLFIILCKTDRSSNGRLSSFCHYRVY